MRPAKKVFLFVAISVIVYCILSLISLKYGLNFLSFNNVNVLSDIVVVPKDSAASQNLPANAAQKGLTPDTATNTANSNTKTISGFKNYTLAGRVTSFRSDTSIPSLTHLDAKLLALKKGKKVKIRIAYLGDSMIEGDLITQTLRKLLQHEYGGYGVGFIPVTSRVSKFRQTASDDYSGNWQDDNFKTASATSKQTLFLSGHTFRADNARVKISDRTVKDSMLLEKSLLCGHVAGTVDISYNDRPFSVEAPQSFNRILLSTDYSNTAKLSVSNASLPVYGISFESPYGITLDNFSFRGISGFELNSFDINHLKKIASDNSYDLIILGYGVNLLFRPNDTKFSWYQKLLNPVVAKFREGFPDADILMVSTADRAFRYNGEYKSAIGIDSLIAIQAKIAYDNGICFYNQFTTMGGTNSIVKWANQTPPLANKDYIHANFRGAEILAENFFNAIINDYKKYIKQAAANKIN